MTTVLSNMDDELSDVEVVYEEVSLQTKLRQELNMLEILRDSRDPIPADYNAFKECVARLKYTYCQEVIDSVWSKLKDLMTLEKEGKLGRDFNRRSLCGRDNCVCGKELPTIELTSSSESESDCQYKNKHYTAHVHSRVQKTSIYEASVLNTSVVEGCSYQHESRSAPSNCNKYSNKNDNDSTEVYSKSCRESVTAYEKEIEIQEKKTNRIKKGSVDVSESDSHTESHNKRSKSKSKENSEFIESIDYCCHKRKYCENSSEEYSSAEKQTRNSDDVTYSASKFSSNNETVDNTKVNTDSDTLFSAKKKEKQKESVKESTDNEDDMYKKDRWERGKKMLKKDVCVNISEVHNTDTFEHIRSRNQNTSNTTNEKRKKHEIENENISCFYNDSFEMNKDSKSECSISSSKLVKNNYKKQNKNTNSDNIPNVDIYNHNKFFYNNKNSNSGASDFNEKYKAKVKDQSWSKNLSGITKHMCELIENDVKTEEDNCGKTSSKKDSRRKKQRCHSYSNAECRRNDREQSVTIDAHIQIVHSSNNGRKNKDNSDSSNDTVINNESPKKADTSSKKTQNRDEKHNRSSNSFSKAKLKKFIEIENKKRRKEKVKIINHEWQLIHDRLVQLMMPKIFKENINNSS